MRLPFVSRQLVQRSERLTAITARQRVLRSDRYARYGRYVPARRLHPPQFGIVNAAAQKTHKDSRLTDSKTIL